MPEFEDLTVWKRAIALSVSIYKETSAIRDFGFRDQFTRAGLSIPSNIAEGIERISQADQCRFLDYARASCGEVRTQTIVDAQVGFIPAGISDHWCHEKREIAAMINGLIRSIRSKQD